MKIKIRLQFSRPFIISDKLKWDETDIVSCYIEEVDLPDFIRGKKPITFSPTDDIKVGLKIDRFSWIGIFLSSGEFISSSVWKMKLNFWMLRWFGFGFYHNI